MMENVGLESDGPNVGTAGNKSGPFAVRRFLQFCVCRGLDRRQVIWFTCVRACVHRHTPSLPPLSHCLSVQVVDRQRVHEPVDDVEQRKRQRKHSPCDPVHLASLLLAFRVDDPRRSAVSAVLDDVNLSTHAQTNRTTENVKLHRNRDNDANIHAATLSTQSRRSDNGSRHFRT